MEVEAGIRLLLLTPTPPPAGQEGPCREPARPCLRPSTRVDRIWCPGAPSSYEHASDCARGVPFVVERVRWAESRGYDAVVVACMLDPGVAEARRAVAIPVVGIGQASRAVADLIGDRAAYIFPRDLRVSELELDAERTFDELLATGSWYVQNTGADVLVPNCALLSPSAERLQSKLGVPVLANEEVGLGLAELLVVSTLRRSPPVEPPGRAVRAGHRALWIAARVRKRLLFALPPWLFRRPATTVHGADDGGPDVRFVAPGETLDTKVPDADAWTRRYLAPLVRDGAEAFVANARVSAAAIVVGGRALPVILSEGRGDDASICSIPSHHLGYAREELTRLQGRWRSRAASLFLSVLRPIVELGRMGRVAYLNNWLLTTNPPLGLSAEELDRVTRELVRRFPDRAVVVRSVNAVTRAGEMGTLVDAGYQLVRSRRVYVFDPGDRERARAKNLRRDLRFLKRWDGDVRLLDEPDSDQVSRIRELYSDLYLGKYSDRNPQFTDRFFASTIGPDRLVTTVFEKHGELQAFSSWFDSGEEINAALIGYDLAVGRSERLLGQVFGIKFRLALDSGTKLHLSGGNGAFKRHRGALPTSEYDAVYTRHLAAPRRLAWASFRILQDLARRFEGATAEKRRAPAVGQPRGVSSNSQR